MTIDKQASEEGPADAAVGSPIGFRLDPGSGVPTYLQLVHQVEQWLRLGYLTEGDRLPTVKEAVESLAINPNTVLKAYRELEHRGLAAGKPGQGTFIEGELRRVGLAEQAALRKSLLTWLRTAQDAGLDGDGITALFATSLRDFLERRGGQGEHRGGQGQSDGKQGQRQRDGAQGQSDGAQDQSRGGQGQRVGADDGARSRQSRTAGEVGRRTVDRSRILSEIT